MRFLSDRLWPQIQPALEAAREVLVTTWNLNPDALVELANAAPKARIRLIIDRKTAHPPFTGDEYKTLLDQLGERVEIRANKGPRVLHAKVLIVRGPSDFAIVGSGNLTKPGFGCDESGNIEASVLFEQGPEFNNILVWFEQLFSTMQAYIQPPDELILNAFPFTKVEQRILDEERQNEQELKPDTSWEDTLSTTTSGIEGLAQRVIEGMKEPPSQLRVYQQTILQTLEQNWAKKDFRELIVLPVGAGKTRVATEFIARCFSQPTTSMRILWVAHTLQLVEQAASAVLSRLCVNGDPVPTVLLWVGGAQSKYEAKRLRRTDPCIAFATVQSLNSLQQEIGGGRKTFDLVVVDEAHHMGAQKWCDAIHDACRNGDRRLLGLTATPDRLDDVPLNFRQHHDGDVTFRKLVGDGVLAVPVYRAVQTEDGKVIGIPSARSAREAERNFERDIRVFDVPWRNHFIARDLAQRASGQTLVFCANIQHTENLKNELVKAGLHEDQVRSVHSGMPVAQRSEALDWFRTRGPETRILLNCKLYIEGFDMTDVRTVVLARPTLSPTYWVQMIGRGVRRDKEHPSFDIIEYTDEYDQERWDALRASFYLLHDNGLQWWRELRERWPDSIEPELINLWNETTHTIYSKMLATI